MISICTSVIIITIISFLFTGTRVIVLPVLPNQCGERKEVCEHFMSLGWGPHQKPCHWQRPENHQLHQSSLLEPNFSRPAPFALFIAKTNLPYSFISYAAVIKDHKRQPLQKSFANKNLVRLHVPRKNTFFTHSFQNSYVLYLSFCLFCFRESRFNSRFYVRWACAHLLDPR